MCINSFPPGFKGIAAFAKLLITTNLSKVAIFFFQYLVCQPTITNRPGRLLDAFLILCDVVICRLRLSRSHRFGGAVGNLHTS